MMWPLLCLVVAYPLLTHGAVLLREPRLQWLALTVLTALALFDGLAKRRPWAWIALPIVSAAIFGLTRLGGGLYALYAPPVLLPAALLVLFARSLRPGATPLITRFAEAARGELPADLAQYTRSVTLVWSFAFAMLATSALLLAVFASHALWSTMTNFIHYLLLGALFLVEYLYRLHRFRHLEHPGFLAYIRMLFTTRIRSL